MPIPRLTNKQFRAAVGSFIHKRVGRWNDHDLDGFCRGYGEDGTHLTKDGVVHGREAILALYRAKYPNRASMGTLVIHMMELRCGSCDAHESAGFATAILKWSIEPKPDGTSGIGYSMVTFELREDGMRVVQDGTVMQRLEQIEKLVE